MIILHWTINFMTVVVCFQLLFLNKLLSVLYLEIFCLTGLFKKSLKDQNFDWAVCTCLCVVCETQGSLGRVAMFGPSYFPEGVKKIMRQEKKEKGDEVHDDDGVKEPFQEDNGSKTHRMLSVLLTDLAHWRYLLTADRLLLLLLTIADRLLLLCCCRLFSPSAKSTAPIVLLLTDTNKRLHQKSILFGDQHFRILPKKEPCFKILFGQVTFFFIWWLKNIGLVLSSSCIWGGIYFSFWHF